MRYFLPLALSGCVLWGASAVAQGEPAPQEPESATKSDPQAEREAHLAEYYRLRRALSIQPGQAAPEWIVSGWTDGQERQLADYRGQVVVLDFWGDWCGPCLQGLPIVEELQKKYHDKNVVFFGIHSAGSEIERVREVLAKYHSTLISGLDRGQSLEQGETVKRYRFVGWPTTVVIDTAGMVTWTTDAFTGDRAAVLKEMQRLAGKAGLPWPIEEGATSDEEKQRRTLAYEMYLFSEPIDAALAKATDQAE